MAVAFSTCDSETIARKIGESNRGKRDKCFSLDEMYEIDTCVQWINENEFTKIALQFPDSLLNDSTAVALKLSNCTKKEIYILGDTSYGSCCVDEVAAEHVQSDAIIHFGHSCLSPNKKIPVLYVFGKEPIDSQQTVSTFRKLIPDVDTYVILIFEVVFTHAIGEISGYLKEYRNLVVSELEIPKHKSSLTTMITKNTNRTQVKRCHRKLLIQNNMSVDGYKIFYIGSRSVTLTNFMINFKNCHFLIYNPSETVGQLESLDANRHLKRRYYYIEKAKDANIIGILVGTLGVSNYLDIINHLKDLVKKAGKKFYVLAVGKLNIAKLANFSEIEIFVNVACIESTIVESKEFYQPIITPYELELALNQARKWTGDYITDFREIIAGASNYIPFCAKNGNKSDVSLITGKIRHTTLVEEDAIDVSKTSLVAREDMKVSNVHAEGAGELFLQRAWKGLEQKLGETPVSSLQQGQKGIASKYEDEYK